MPETHRPEHGTDMFRRELYAEMFFDECIRLNGSLISLAMVFSNLDFCSRVIDAGLPLP